MTNISKPGKQTATQKINIAEAYCSHTKSCLPQKFWNYGAAKSMFGRVGNSISLLTSSSLELYSCLAPHIAPHTVSGIS